MLWKLRRNRRSYSEASNSSILASLVRVMRWGFRIVLLLLIVDVFYMTLTWPDWSRLTSGPMPKSRFISEYEKLLRADRSLPRLRWQPVALTKIPKYIQRTVILAEDSRFYQHSGFDLIAFREAMHYNLSERRLAFGGSTISQQTAKNLFLSSSRNPLRKWHELILTWGMERSLTKDRILEIYLNVAEFGPGIYGVGAAAQAYWHKPVSELTLIQAAELAASLPSPKTNNPATRTQRFVKRTQKIVSFIYHFGLELAPKHKP